MKKQTVTGCENSCVGCKKIVECPLHSHKESITAEEKLVNYIFNGSLFFRPESKIGGLQQANNQRRGEK